MSTTQSKRESSLAKAEAQDARQLRLGFLGVGWIGLSRLRAIVEAGAGTVACVSDPSQEALAQAGASLESAAVCASLDELLENEVDGVVIATPSALHASQAMACLERGVAVFCQKPLARNEAEARRVVEAARSADRLLGVDLSYRHVEAVRHVVDLLCDGALGEVFAVELEFHNAYGPDKPWFRDPTLSGGGCVVDLGTHLIDLAMLCMGWPEVEDVRSSLYHGGTLLRGRRDVVEDYAVATLSCSGGACVRLACSWNLHAGVDAEIRVVFRGTKGSAEVVNVGGSFYDFESFLYRGTQRERLFDGDDAWGGRAAVAWAKQLAKDPGFDGQVERAVDVSQIIDRIYSA